MKRQNSVITSITLIIIVFLMLSIIVGGLAGWIMPEDGSVNEFISYIITAVLTISFAFLIRRFMGITIPTFKPEIRRISPTLVVSGLIMIFAMGVVISPLLKIIPEMGMDILKGYMDQGGLWMMLSAVIAAPIFEEYLFRGIIQTNIIERFGVIPGILISAVIFGTIHIIPQQAFNAMCIGLILGGVYYLTGSLITVVVLHAFNNGIVSLLNMIFQDTEYLQKLVEQNATFHALTYALSVIIIFFGIIYLIRVVRERKKIEEIRKTTE